MVGAGVFAAVGAAAVGGAPALLLGLLVAGSVAYANATSSAELAAVHPAAGGTYVYGRERLGPAWGHLAGWGFVVGKTASCAAMALTFGAYVAPSIARPLALAAVVALTLLDARGVQRTATAMRVGLAIVLLSLLVVVVASGTAPSADLGRLTEGPAPTPGNVLEAAGLLFFAFAGYARIATLGEEVRDPATTIPRAVPLALGAALLTYVLVTVAAVSAVGADVLAAADAPLAVAVAAGRLPELAGVVRVGAAAAAAGVLLSLLAGVARTSLAMARDGHLPRPLARVHPERRVPHVAQLAVGATVAVVVLVADLRGAIGFSSFSVLAYYAIANLSALRLADHELRWPRWLAAFGVVGCVVLALSLPRPSVFGGVALLIVGRIAYAVTSRRGARED